MKEIKLMVDGKEVQLTEEQLKLLGFEVRKNPFERAVKGGRYFYINVHGVVRQHYDVEDPYEEKAYEVANYFTDEVFANQVALHQLLYRKLLKFAYDNECEDTAEWDRENAHWTIRYDDLRNEFCPYYQDDYKTRDVHFSSEEGAERAIEDVVKPFVKEHPEFVW